MIEDYAVIDELTELAYKRDHTVYREDENLMENRVAIEDVVDESQSAPWDD